VNGIDFWTTGAPPHRFQVLGIFVDKRPTGWISGNAVGSKSIATKAHELGADGVIVLDQSSRVTGYLSGGQATAAGNTAYGSGWSAPVEQATTRLVVVKYLPAD
jgi:hypothetical protein